jgi:[ribosomal protein S18]-alanine N-acetyltransferase
VTRVRPAGAADVDSVVALERAVFGPDAWSPAAVEEELTGPLRQAFVAVDESDAVCGYVVLLTVADVADLQRICVHESHRRHGVATALLQACELAGAQRVVLEVRADNDDALAFYRRHGFCEASRRRRYYADGVDAVLLERDVRSAGFTAAADR